MALFSIIPKNPLKGFKPVVSQFVLNHTAGLSSKHKDESLDEEGEFRQFQLRPSRAQARIQRRVRGPSLAPRDYKRVDKLNPDNLDWKSVWPGPRTFDPNSVPLPVRQGRLRPQDVPYDKYANMELMKIPNFLHLTPPAIKAHCEELKKFCTPFPKELDTREKCEKAFPLTVITNDYLHSAPTIRDPLARIVTVKLKLKDIPLDKHARDKFRRLVKERYDEKSDTLVIVTDRCPLRKQNYDYAQYLLTALFFESWRVEEWEAEKSEADMEEYIWKNNISAKALASILKWTPDKFGKSIFHECLPEEKLQPEHHVYGAAVKKVLEGETEENLKEYKAAALEVLLQKKVQQSQV